MFEKELLSVDDVAVILGKTPNAIRMAIYRGQEGKTIPPSVKLGNSRRWLRKTVYDWLDEISETSVNIKNRQRGRPRRRSTGCLRKDIANNT